MSARSSKDLGAAGPAEGLPGNTKLVSEIIADLHSKTKNYSSFEHSWNKYLQESTAGPAEFRI